MYIDKYDICTCSSAASTQMIKMYVHDVHRHTPNSNTSCLVCCTKKLGRSYMYSRPLVWAGDYR